MRLDRLANLSIAALCCVLAAKVASSIYFDWSRQEKPPATAESTDAPRQFTTIAETPELALRDSRKTLVLVAASTCIFCTRSMPFYRRLASEARSNGIQFVAATNEDLQRHTNYLNEHGVGVDKVVSAGKNGIHVSGTPTLLVVQSDGRVGRMWRGQLRGEREKDVFEELRR
jgi:thiol-disulfide isomerase/thioredoxin